jgi:hypothetical protein
LLLLLVKLNDGAFAVKLNAGLISGWALNEKGV